MRNLTAVDYIRTSLNHDFESQAPIIETWLENRMEDLNDLWIPITCEEQAEFQGILETLVYPYLACYKALIDAGVPDAHAGNYCKQIWTKMPVSVMTS